MAKDDFVKRGIDGQFTHTCTLTPSHPHPVSGVQLNLGNMMKAKETSVAQLTDGVAALFKMNKVWSYDVLHNTN